MATFTNTATLLYNGTTTSSNTTVGELLEQLSVTKTAVKPIYSVGDDITYAINLINSGTTPINDITVTDNLGSYTYGALTLVPLDYVDGSVRLFVNGVLAQAPTVSTAAGNLVINGIDIPAGGNVAILYEAAPNRYASPEANGSVTNTVTATGADITNAETASETVTADSAANLSITKAMTPSSVSPNGTLTYTLTILNNGNSAVAAADDAVISDTFNPILKNITVTLNSAPQTEGTDYTYSETTGQFSTVAGKLAVPAATFSQNTTTGEWITTPGTSVIVISGTV